MGRKKILLIDDQELIGGLEKSFFRRQSFHLLVARSGAQVWEMVEREEPDLVFLNLEMPELAGDLCCRRIKEDLRFCGTPVVLICADRQEDVQRGRQSGCDEILIRPIRRCRLTHLVRRLLAVAARQVPRCQASVRIGYSVHPGVFRAARALNLGTGGVLVQTTEMLPVGTPLHLEIFLPGFGAPIRCHGQVVWLNHGSVRAPLEGEMGVEFLDLPPAAKNAIRDYLEKEGLRASGYSFG